MAETSHPAKNKQTNMPFLNAPIYPLHHIGIDFMGPLPLSNGNQHILLIGDHFTKWYEAVPLPDQPVPTTANALL